MPSALYELLLSFMRGTQHDNMKHFSVFLFGSARALLLFVCLFLFVFYITAGHVRLGKAVPRGDVQGVREGLSDRDEDGSLPQCLRSSRDVEGTVCTRSCRLTFHDELYLFYVEIFTFQQVHPTKRGHHSVRCPLFPASAPLTRPLPLLCSCAGG